MIMKEKKKNKRYNFIELIAITITSSIAIFSFLVTLYMAYAFITVDKMILQVLK
jgi:hypothetical protein